MVVYFEINAIAIQWYSLWNEQKLRDYKTSSMDDIGIVYNGKCGEKMSETNVVYQEIHW